MTSGVDLGFRSARSKIAADARDPALVLAAAVRTRLFPGGQARHGYPVLSRLREERGAEIPLADLASLLVELKRIAPDVAADAGIASFRKALLDLVTRTRDRQMTLYAIPVVPAAPPGVASAR